MEMEIPDDFCSYVSAPDSPGRYCSSANNNNVCFFSVPTSPRKRTISSTSDDYPTPPMTPYHDANSNLDDFEFDTSHSFNLGSVCNVTSQKVKDLLEHNQREQMQTMAFADDLFCGGKVIPLAPPLKLPPRLGQKRYTNRSPTPSTPGSPSFGIKIPFSHRTLWNDDFDPFMVALQHVRKEEKRGKAKTQACDMSDPNDQQNKQTGLPIPISSPFVNSPSLLQSPKRLALPRGLEFARQVKLIRMDHSERCSDPKLETRTPKNNIAQESGGPCTKQTKGQRIRRLLLSVSFGKADDEDKKGKDQTSEILKKPTFLRRLSFKSGRLTSCKAEKRISNQLAKTPLVQFRPRLLLCMGYKARHAKRTSQCHSKKYCLL